MEQPLATFTSIQMWPKIRLNLYESEVETYNPGLWGMGGAKHRIRYEQIANVGVSRKITYSLLIIESTGGLALGVPRMDHKAAKEAHEAVRQRMELVASFSDPTSSPASDILAQIKSLVVALLLISWGS